MYLWTNNSHSEKQKFGIYLMKIKILS